jgi:phosphate-selective porin OprO/OprP
MEPLAQTSNDFHRSEHWSLMSRTTFAPIARRRKVIHFGVSAEFRDMIDDSTYSISARPESGLAPPIVRTGGLADVDTMVGVGAEAAALFGPVLLQGEYRRAFLQREAGRPDPSFDGGYVQASWVVTGERRQYNRNAGLFEGVSPRSDWGAVELAVRASQIDLRDETVDGGRARNLTMGVNWYIRSNVRLMFNYVYVDGKQPGTGFAADPQIFQLRLQVHF